MAAPQPSESEAPSPGPVMGGCQFRAVAEKAIFTRGEPVMVRLTLTNPGPGEVRFHDSVDRFDFSVDARDQNGKRVPLTPYATQGGGVHRNILRTLTPGASMQYRLEVSKLVEMARPGAYSFRVLRMVLQHTTRGWIANEIASNLVKIRVV